STTTQLPTLAPFDTLGQLSIAPATQTTVVTTTTTTTTSFPPILMSAPRCLSSLDAKDYPLAHVPAPESIRRFSFAAGDAEARFEEADHVGAKVQEQQHLYECLKASNGKIETVTSYQGPPQFSTPNRPGLRSRTSRSSFSAKPASPPPSISEAAELARLQRRAIKSRPTTRGRKLRGSLAMGGVSSTPEDMDDVVPATPDTDVGSSGPCKVAKTRPASCRSQMKPELSPRRLRPSSSHVRETAPANTRRPRLSHVPEPTVDHGSFALDEELAGIAATPPITENDLEPIVPLDEPCASSARPIPLDTISAQDVCLPSPSLSPITAAANAGRSAGFTPTTSTEDSSRSSGFNLTNPDPVYTAALAGDDTVSPFTLSRPEMANQTGVSQQSVPAPPLMGVPQMISSFDSLPEEMKRYVMFKLLQGCQKQTLHFVANVVNPALKCDFIRLLPLELSLNIIKYLDLKSLCSAAQVSRWWRHVIDTDEAAWKSLLEKDGYTLPPGELERAVNEGWGWQYPHSSGSWERDLRSSPVLLAEENSDIVFQPAAGGRLKRKSTAKHGSSKKQRRKGGAAARSPPSLPTLPRALNLEGPNAIAEIAAAAVPSPEVGLPSLRCMHLYKSLYQRHHLIKKSWMEEDSKPKHIAFSAHQRHVVTCLQFDTDKIITGSDDTNIHVYDTKTGALRNRFQGHEGGVWALQYEGNTLVSGSTDRSIRVWDLAQGKCTAVYHGHTSTVRCLVILKPTQVGETADGQPIMMPKEPLIITGSRDSSLRVWKLPSPTGPVVRQVGPPADDSVNPYFVRVLNGHHHSVRAIAAHADTLVSGSYDCTVRVWKISTGETVHRLQGHTAKVYSVVLDTARNRCISGSMDTMVKIWSLETGQCVINLEGHTSLVGLLDLSYDRLVSAAADSTLRIWDPATGACKSTLSAHTGAITCFQHDSQKVISGSDRTLKMWNVKTGKFVKDLLTDLSGVWQVKFNERRCVAAVQRNSKTYIEVLDFGASRDGVSAEQRGRRIVVNSWGEEIEDVEE
ncbi:WD40 repeat-like protein, partial [Sporormia fimetaria CBS 119925]